jgi:hypothetical protein
MSESRLFSIIEILQSVRKKSETGCLRFTENGTVIAELFFNKGRLYHARNGKSVGDDVVYQLLGNKTAVPRWNRSLTTSDESISSTDEMLMLGALGILTVDDSPAVADLKIEEEPATPTPPPATPVARPQVPVQTPPSPPQAVAEKPKTRQLPPDWDGLDDLFNQVVPEPAVAPTPTPAPNPTPTPSSAQPPVSDAPVLSGGASLESMGKLRTLLGDEVLRPPRFRRWSGVPLPFVSAYSLDPYLDGRLVRNVIELLWRERFSGFMTCVQNPIEGMSLMYKGRSIQARYADGKVSLRDQNALRYLADVVVPETERNPILIYPLEPDFVHSYAALLNGEVLLDKFSSQGMKINKLLNTLEHSQHTGVVRVSNDGENGFIFLSNGHKLGSYYEVEDYLEESILRVYQIVGKPGSLIDVLTSPAEEKMFETNNRPKSPAEVKQQIIEIAQEVFGKRASRVVSLVGQSDDDVASLKTYCNQARRVAQMFIDKNLADQFYERAMFLLQELGN